MYRFVTYSSSSVESPPSFCQPGFLVNQFAQLNAQSSATYWVVGALNNHTGLLDARCAFFAHNTLAISPKQHSFGSVEFIDNLPDAVLEGFLDTLEKAVDTAGLSGLRLTHYPRIYAPQQTDQLLAHLSKRGFRIIDSQRNSHLVISGKSFVEGLHDATRRRLVKSQRAGLVARHWPNPDLDRVISFLQASRTAQGYPLTMPADTLRYWLSTAPADYLVFAVFDHGIIAALTVAVRMRFDILYNFLPADNAGYRSFSPAILLTECLYSYCQTHRFNLLDLGISVDENRQPKPGLIRFKRNLGAAESEKLILSREEVFTTY